MKSVGEVMAIGRNFNEALQKACQSLEIRRNGISADGRESQDRDELMQGMANPSWNRLFQVKDAIHLGIPLKTIEKTTRIDKWFLNRIVDIDVIEKKISEYTLDTLPDALFLEAKKSGFSDRQIGYLLEKKESEIRAKRLSLNIRRVFKMVDTCAAEFPAQTPYYYSTFDDENESIVSDKKKVIVLGSGPNRIGQGIEFDYCCVHGIMAAKECGYETIMINCNPETVSTDFNVADKLYFEPLYWEHVLDIIEHEKPEGVIVQLGGQTALKLAEKLHQNGIKIMGSSFKSLDLAEDRGSFSTLLKDLGIPYPRFGVAETADEALSVAAEVGYPVLVRPSYVLGGQGMKIVINDEELESHVVALLNDLPGNKVLIDHFLDRAIEAESDAISDGKDTHILGIMEHIEPAGIHSGDSSAVLPPFDLTEAVLEKIKSYTHRLATALEVVGLINIQFAIKGDEVFVIEANPRASRTVPFIAKAYGEPYVNWASKVMLGDKKVKDFTFSPKLNGFAIKIPVFSYDKFPEIGKELGPEMKSTGEEIRFIKDLQDPFFVKAYSERSLYLSK
jgi:carbamoyl-phosphate synthase large subunit